MALSRLTQRKLIFSQDFLRFTGNSPLTYLDIGARGDLEAPWSLMPVKSLSVVGFEPDQEECARLNSAVPLGVSRRYVPAALWSHIGEVMFHINAASPTSSVYPTNLDLIRRYEKEHWETRQTVRTMSSRATTLDQVMAENALHPDFLKIDTQGAEWDILMGAKRVLNNDVVGVVAETWTVEVYKGQKASGDVFSIMKENGFSLYDANVAAAWRRRAGLLGKAQIVGLDFLFLNDDPARLLASGGYGKVIKAAAVADLYGFPDVALDMLEQAARLSPADKATLNAAAAHVEEVARQGASLARKIQRRLIRLMGRDIQEFPSLHY